MDSQFDLDVTFDVEPDDKLIARMSKAELEKKVGALPHELSLAAHGVLVQGRTYSDVSQELGIRQPELVRAVHRAKLLITG
jgi:DNA-directed RNA polymerase specialized sigma24 family protein